MRCNDKIIYCAEITSGKINEMSMFNWTTLRQKQNVQKCVLAKEHVLYDAVYTHTASIANYLHPVIKQQQKNHKIAAAAAALRTLHE